MPYFVVGSDGNEYGPVDIDTLKQWATENRIQPTTSLRDEQSGVRGLASQVPGLFTASAPAVSTSPPMGPPSGNPSYGNPTVDYPRPSDQVNDSFPVRTFLYPLGGLISFFVCGGFGFIFAGYGVYYAYQQFQSGSKWGVAALVWSIVCMVAILGGYALGSRGGLTRF